MVQALIEPQRRAVAAAILLFVTNLLGSGLGPLVMGVLSDALVPRLGADSLSYALTAVAALSGWAALYYVTAGRTLAEDLWHLEGERGRPAPRRIRCRPGTTVTSSKAS